MLPIIGKITSKHISFSCWQLVFIRSRRSSLRLQTHNKPSARQSNEICSGTNDRFGIISLGHVILAVPFNLNVPLSTSKGDAAKTNFATSPLVLIKTNVSANEGLRMSSKSPQQEWQEVQNQSDLECHHGLARHFHCL